MYSAEAEPCAGSEKQTWNILSLSAVTLGEEAEGVSMKTRSSYATAETATQGVVVTQPMIS